MCAFAIVSSLLGTETMSEAGNRASTQELRESSEACLKAYEEELQASRVMSWDWAEEEFRAGLSWLQAHPHEIRRGVYLSNTPGKEVWRLTLPARYGGHEIIYKNYIRPKTFWDAFEKSESVVEAMNYRLLESFGVPTPRVMGCGEHRSLGVIQESFIVTEYLDCAVDGSVLMPGGQLSDRGDIRSAFAGKAIELLASMHQCRFFHNAFHPHKILIHNVMDFESMRVSLIDVANATYKPRSESMLSIARDIFTLVADLRLNAEDIQMLCGRYLEFNRHCGYTPEALWKMITSL